MKLTRTILLSAACALSLFGFGCTGRGNAGGGGPYYDTRNTDTGENHIHPRYGTNEPKYSWDSNPYDHFQRPTPPYGPNESRVTPYGGSAMGQTANR